MEQRLRYFDHNATTAVAPEVIDAMLPVLREHWGNPSSAYVFGHETNRYLDRARLKVAELVNAEPGEIVFTGCGTESNNTALHSALVTQPGKRHVITTAVEHSATLKFCAHLQRRGFDVTYLPVNGNGALDLDALRSAIRSDTAIVSAMLANNETGIVFPVAEIGTICREKGVLFHTDAVQAAGKIPVDMGEIGADMLSLSAHKLYAPKGVGALFVRQGLQFQPYLMGGSQERGRRGGTENTAGIVAFGRAAEIALARLSDEQKRLSALRDCMEDKILLHIPGVHRNGAAYPRLPNTSNLSFEAVEAEGVLLLLDQAGICASSGSACTTGSLEPSHVLTAMGCSSDRARGSLRFSLGRGTTQEDVDYLLSQLGEIIAKLRRHLPLPAKSVVSGTTRQ